MNTIPTCFLCNKNIAENQWFCRLPQKPEGGSVPDMENIFLCSPTCALRYFASVSQSGDSENRGRYEGSPILVDGEQSG